MSPPASILSRRPTLSIGDAKLPSDLLDGDLVIATQSGRCYEQESNGTALREKYRFNAPVDPRRPRAQSQ